MQRWRSKYSKAQARRRSEHYGVPVVPVVPIGAPVPVSSPATSVRYDSLVSPPASPVQRSVSLCHRRSSTYNSRQGRGPIEMAAGERGWASFQCSAAGPMLRQSVSQDTVGAAQQAVTGCLTCTRHVSVLPHTSCTVDASPGRIHPVKRCERRLHMPPPYAGFR